MAYLNEFPHFEADKLNLDWILEQYSTFNKRLEEIMAAFQTAVDEMQEDVDEIRSYTQEQIAQVRSDFESFTAQVNENFDNLSDDLQQQVNTSVTNIYHTIDRITDNMTAYVGEHMSEWQAEASYNDHNLLFNPSSNPLLDYAESINKVIIGNKVRDLRLAMPQYIKDNNNLSISSANSDITNSNIHLEGIGTYLVVGQLSINWSYSYLPIGSVEVTASTESGINTLIPIKVTYESDNNAFSISSGTIMFIGLYVNTSNTSKDITLHLNQGASVATELRQPTNIKGIALKLSDTWTPQTY